MIVGREGGGGPPRTRSTAVGTRADRDAEAIRPFLIGTAVGGVVGAIAGTLLSHRTRRLLRGLIQLAARRLTAAEREELRFELLLQ